MTEEHRLTTEPNKSWYKARIVIFVASSILIAITLVLISMALYASSGSAQLDLSRPGYQSVQSQVDSSDAFKSFPATGSVDAKTIDQFQKLFEDQIRQVTAVDAFSPNVLESQALGIDSPEASE